jgi:hypothetical protein
MQERKCLRIVTMDYRECRRYAEPPLSRLPAKRARKTEAPEIKTELPRRRDLTARKTNGCYGTSTISTG